MMRKSFLSNQPWWTVTKDNYRESEALTKKIMGLKGKGESKTVTWQPAEVSRCSHGGGEVVSHFLSLRSDEFHDIFV